MAIKVEIIKEGYSFLDEKSKTMKANCTCTLIRDNKQIILVDTLTAWDKLFLTKALEERNIKPDDVNHVIGTHGHSDHIGNLNLFTHAEHIVGQSISFKDEYKLYSFEEEGPYRLSENVKIIATPGHTLSDVSVIVQESSDRTVAIVGDLFEKREDITNPDIWCNIAGSENPELQFQNRTMILQSANYIIPGHGPAFEVTQEIIESHKNFKS